MLEDNSNPEYQNSSIYDKINYIFYMTETKKQVTSVMNKKMDSMRNGIALLLSMAMLLFVGVSMISPVHAATLPFSDVPAGKWYTQAVQYCFEKGYVGGYEDKSFRPNNDLTRAEMAVIMNKKLGLSGSARNTFTDVSAGKWYTDAVLHCVKAGIMSGYSDTRFGTSDKLTREQGAVILAKAFQVDPLNGRTAFSDDSSISRWAVESVKAMASQKLVSGMGNNRFEPKLSLTRAQMCQIIYAAEGKNGEDRQDTAQDPAPSDPSEDKTPVQPGNDPLTPVKPESEDAVIREGEVEDLDTKDSWETSIERYLEEKKIDKDDVTYIDVDGDDYKELVIRENSADEKKELVTYHDGSLSILPMNDTAMAYAPKENRVLLAGYDKGQYLLSVYSIENGSWEKIATGSFEDSEEGSTDDIFVNFRWNGKEVTEIEFYSKLVEEIDVENLVELS